MLPFRTLTKTHEQERTRVHTRRSGPRHRGSYPAEAPRREGGRIPASQPIQNIPIQQLSALSVSEASRP
jgi:hypothetical protein